MPNLLSNSHYLLLCLVLNELIKLDNSNQLQANATDKKTIKFFENIQGLYEKDIIFPGENVVEAFNEGKIAMVAIGIRLLHVFELNEEIGIMYLPRTQEISEHVVPVLPEVSYLNLFEV